MAPANRRHFLCANGLLLAGMTNLPAGARQRGKDDPPYPGPVGYKFTADGRVKPFAGNTIVCHLPQQGEGQPVFDHFLDIYRELPAHGFTRKITALPPSSYHMTIFGGANDSVRKPGLWPKDLPLDLPLAECDRILGDRLRNARFDVTAPIRMRIDDREPPHHTEPLLIDLVPVDEAENRRLRQMRDEISTLLGIRAPNHDRYQFHITLAYQVAWFNATEQQEYEATCLRWRQGLRRQVPLVTFGPPEYCTLKDMFAFNRQFYLTAG